MLVVKGLDGFVRIVDSGKRVGQHNVRDVVSFSKNGKNEIVFYGEVRNIPTGRCAL